MPAENGIASRSFYGTSGGAEHFITVEAPEALPFGEQVRAVEARYAAARRSLGLDPETAVFRRLFLSDILNQAALVGESALGTRAARHPHRRLDRAAVAFVRRKDSALGLPRRKPDRPRENAAFGKASSRREERPASSLEHAALRQRRRLVRFGGGGATQRRTRNSVGRT